MTNDELRMTNEAEMPAVPKAPLSPAMKRWKEKMESGYTIRPRMRRGRSGYVEWGPALYNPDGSFVQNVNRRTFRRLLLMGIVRGAR